MRSFWTKKVSKNEILFGARHRKEKFELLGTRNSWAVSRPPDGGVQDVHGLHGGRLVCPPQEGEVRGQRAVERLAVHVGPLGGAGASQMGGGVAEIWSLESEGEVYRTRKRGQAGVGLGESLVWAGTHCCRFFFVCTRGVKSNPKFGPHMEPISRPPQY